MLRVGDMAVLHNNVLDKQSYKKLGNHWLGRYLIREARLDLAHYYLSELDDAQLNEVYVGDRLKRFFQREGIEHDAEDIAAHNGLDAEVEEETEKE